MAQPFKHLYTTEEYFALEEKAEYRSEYYNGEIFRMAGGFDPHNQIAGNCYVALRLAFRSGTCRAYISDMKVQILQSKYFLYPDIMAVCGEVIFVPKRTDALTNPVLIIEVLSDSTRDYDRSDKFELYRKIETLQEYVLIDQKRAYVEVHQKQPQGVWQLEEYTDPNAIVKLASIDFEVGINELYEGVQFPEKAPKRRRTKIRPV